MGLLVVGSIARDTIETSFGREDNILGGSAIYFSYGASFFAPVSLFQIHFTQLGIMSFENLLLLLKKVLT